LAIKQSIAIDIEKTKAREAAGEDAMEDVDDEDPVPELTKAHFEEAMASARRSVTDVEIRRYEAFAQQMKNTGGSSFFRFPEAGENGTGANGGGNQFGEAGGDGDLYE
ncbi:AAA ATPase cdc48, partial [Elasticomyces elasticus]